MENARVWQVDEARALTPISWSRSTRQLPGPCWDRSEQAVVLGTDPDRARAIARDYAHFYLGFPSYRNELKKHGFVDADFEDGGTNLCDSVARFGPPGETGRSMTMNAQVMIESGLNANRATESYRLTVPEARFRC
ncbi:hypothetical protein ACWY4P_45145 [Streptomyces sp. LZ34]